jgi:hypothetical protein
MSRLADLHRFYDQLEGLSQRLGGTRTLATLSDFRDWPNRGLYFFFETSENRRESGSGPRIVRVGTHALSAGSRSTLRQRLGQHRGQATGGGNHRGSIFRLLIGQALIARGVTGPCVSWGVKSDIAKASAALKINRADLSVVEASIERAVTKYICVMSFLWIDINDEPGPASLRGFVERNSIALLSNHERALLDPPSPNWLGHSSNRDLVRGSGLWNQRHVGETHDPLFLDVLERAVHAKGRKQ